jgi:hypothetical protein
MDTQINGLNNLKRNKIMKNIHLLPTDKPSRLYKDDNQVLTLNTHPVLKGIFTNGIGSNQHPELN